MPTISVMHAPHHHPASSLTPSLSAGADFSEFTWVELIHHPGVVERWIRFGVRAGEVILDRRSRFFGFAPGSVFAFVRWAAGDYGTVVSRIDILQAVDRHHGCSTIPGVTPGAEILLRLAGWPKVQQVLAAIDAIEALGLDPVEAAPDHWRHVHHRLAAAQPPRPYTAERHRAWLGRRELFS
jgi:Protein of unknown function (DUF2840)